jgi:hypothetical protein
MLKIMNSISRSVPAPACLIIICSLFRVEVLGLTIYYVDVEHNDEMTSLVVKEWQPLSILKMLNAQAMHSRFFGGKRRMLTVRYGLKWSTSFLVLLFTQEMLPLL